MNAMKYEPREITPRVRMAKALWKRLAHRAVDENRSVTSIVVEACEDWLKVRGL